MRRLVVYMRLLILAVLLFSCSHVYYTESTAMKNYPVTSGLVADDPRIDSLYFPYKRNLEADMAKVVGVTATDMEKGKPESLLTNFLADLLLSEGNDYMAKKGMAGNAGVSYYNYGGIRAPLPKGEITTGKVFELMPFENALVLLQVKGSVLKSFLDFIAKKGGDSLGGVKFGIKDGAATNILVGGKPIDSGGTYWVVTNDYIADGGDDTSMLKDRLQMVATGKLIRDVILKYMEDKYKKGEIISPKLDGRIYNE
jgi:2',3'-cyclic-nucleotide 2'-phosphodiesterase (5'-nucleotidase family)